jgi:hypothetical protein
MNRFIALAACGVALSACSSFPSMPSLDLPKGSGFATTIQFESEPAGAEAKVSAGGQSCRTPCSLSVAADEFTVTFTQAGYQQQTVPVRIAASEPVDPATGSAPPPRMVPNPVYVELQPAAPSATARKKPQPAKKPPAARSTTSAPKPAAAPPTAMAPQPAPAAAWPPPPPPR